jgi:hypothetical protein
VVLSPIAYYGTAKKELSIRVPALLVTGHYELSGKIIRDGEIVSNNFYKLFIADRYFTASAVTSGKTILLYDNQGATKKALDALNIKYTEIRSFSTISPNSIVLVGENSADENIAASKSEIKKYISDGGRVLSLRQDSVHLQHLNSLLQNPVTNNNIDIDDPDYPVSVKSPRNGYYVNPERPDHPVFAGITRADLRVWSDYTGWNEMKQGFPAIKPVTDGFNLENGDDVANTAILANYSSGLQAIALAEQFQGNGSILLCGLDLAPRSNIDPVATRLLLNLLEYSSDNTTHERYPLVTSPILWGEYETEKGVVTDLYNGFLVNSTPRVGADYLGKGIVVTKDGYQLAGGLVSGFNTRPGIQYVANGRRPFGPFAQSSGGQPIPDRSTTEGFGKFWCRIPEGQNKATSVVWNPSKEPLTIKIKVNNQSEISRMINAGEKVAIETPVDSSNVGIVYTGDRRLVVLQTAFSKSE